MPPQPDGVPKFVYRHHLQPFEALLRLEHVCWAQIQLDRRGRQAIFKGAGIEVERSTIGKARNIAFVTGGEDDDDVRIGGPLDFLKLNKAIAGSLPFKRRVPGQFGKSRVRSRSKVDLDGHP